jgi:hypothetical protein
MRKLAVIALVLGVLLVPGTALAGGKGDNFNRPIFVGALSYTSVHHNNKGASTQTDEPTPSCQSSFDRTYWYVFTPSSTVFYIADTVGSDFDTVEAIYTYNGSTFTPVACDDDSGNQHGGDDNNNSWLDVQLTSGTTYYIQVGSYRFDYGYLVFHLVID